MVDLLSVFSENRLDESDTFIVELRNELIGASVWITNVLCVKSTSVELTLPCLRFAEDSVLDFVVVRLFVQLTKSWTDDRMPVVESRLDESLTILLDRNELVVTVKAVIASNQILSTKVDGSLVVELRDWVHLSGRLFVGIRHLARTRELLW